MKKTIVLILALVLVMLCAIGATVAWFKSTDAETNVMTIGDVTIDLHEDNGLNAGDADFKLDDDYQAWLNSQILLPNTSVEKDVWVENTGSNAAYIRVHVAVPTAAYEAGIVELEWDANGTYTNFETYKWRFRGENYTIIVATYTEAVASGTSTLDCLSLVKMHQDVEAVRNGKAVTYTRNGKSYTAPNGRIDVEVFAEAGQTGGFATDNASDALDTMFGEIGTYCPWTVGTGVTTIQQLRTVIAKGGTAVLMSDIHVPSADLVPVGAGSTYKSAISLEEGEATIDLNGFTISADGAAIATIAVSGGELTITGDGTVVSPGDDQYVVWARGTGTVNLEGGHYRATGNSTVLYAGAATAGPVINVSGGTYEAETDVGVNMVNIRNHGLGRINITGGTFVAFNPATDVIADDKAFVVIPDGYTVEMNGGNYTVISE